MRRTSVIVIAVLALIAGLAPAARAAEDRCTTPVADCLYGYQKMRERPWLGIEVARDSVTGLPTILKVVPGGPAEKAGLRPGDVLERIDGQVPSQWYAGRAGWKGEAMAMQLEARRDGQARRLASVTQRIPEDYLASIIGEHMKEGHLAWMVKDAGDGHSHDAPERH
jgi:predicted metalloprotease with PDZ domain